MNNTTIRSAENPPLFIKYANAGSIVYPPGGQYGPRFQNDLQLVLLHTGAMNIHIDGVSNQIPIGHVVFLKPGHHEKFIFAKEEETWHRWITITPESLSGKMLDEYESLPLYIPISDKMNQLTSLMMAIHRDHSEDNHEVICSLGQSSMLLYITECRKQYMSKVHPSVLMAKEIIHEKFHEDLSLKDLADKSGVSPEHLIRLFQKLENKTPVQYLWHYRIERGMELLRNTGLPIGEIAYQTGFKTSYHFARLVKKHAGSTPSEIQKQANSLLCTEKKTESSNSSKR
ncbi:AraC family transcriptional regulator [Neobacillus drentensis]|uniref:helix-turn-helix transcriptional regulator n=1 Tax=Neobacillus drentensis TaxID=220684 RepID=UPI003000DD84